MNRYDYIIPHEWAIIENQFDKERTQASESIFSLGNGYMGQRANFEEDYSGQSLQGSYIGGIYYPDKTRVGWWKNGYPEYFAKVLNAPNWIGIHILVNEELLDLNKAQVKEFYRELNMKEGWLKRKFTAILPNKNEIEVESIRFLSFHIKEVGGIQYTVKALNFDGKIEFTPYLDAGVRNEDANYDEFFWKINGIIEGNNEAYILSETLKTQFGVCTGMKNSFMKNGQKISPEAKIIKEEKKISYSYIFDVSEGDQITLTKWGGYTQTMNVPKENLQEVMQEKLQIASEKGFENLLHQQEKDWTKIWETADIEIKGDIKAQQGIRFNIFQLNQTYTGEDPRLNIGPKGFTGEKYGGSTYWDTEAYCLPFYMSTKDSQVAKNLLLYRYNQLGKAIENAQKLGFTDGAALYPMVTMNGEECHNEWEITFEEIHRNGAIVYAIYNYVNYTGDYDYIPQYGIDVMTAVSRFWIQRFNFSEDKQQYVMLGVTGPNEYENNVNNNWYTNYIARWTVEYTLDQLDKIKKKDQEEYLKILKRLDLTKEELNKWKKIISNIYFPYSDKYSIFLQQDGYLDKEIIPASNIPVEQRPINQHWSWDRILRSCYIKQADTLQGMYFFENHFDKKTLEKHFDFYEPLTVHESSLSPCVHSILASSLDKKDKAYEMYVRTARLDLDDYNHEVDEGLHITSMAGTWLAIVQGFGGTRNFDNRLSFEPKIPIQWDSYSFKINYKGATLKLTRTQKETLIENLSGIPVTFEIYGTPITLEAYDKWYQENNK
jgi:maltose phosphorylase